MTTMQSSRVEEKRPHTSYIKCPKCAASIEYWSTSGMSECYPHFYCDTCSNVLYRHQDHLILRDEKSDVLAAIPLVIKSLPKCKCGGQFTLEAEPKCPSCGHELRRTSTSLELRAIDPFAI